MAHGDYECCAICDQKMGYHAFTEDHKTDICPECREKDGIPSTVKQFVALVEPSTKEHLGLYLEHIGFEFCFYRNPVDDLVRERLGIPIEEQFKSSKEWLDMLIQHD